MSKKDEFDLDAEIERLARKSNIQMQKTEYTYNNQLKKLDKEIDKAINDKIKLFDENKQSTADYKNIDFKDDTINRYREKLKKSNFSLKNFFKITDRRLLDYALTVSE